MIDGMGPYLSPLEATQASADETDKALGAVVSMLYLLYQEKRQLRLQINLELNDQEIGDLEYEMKMIRAEESALHRIESGLQSRLSAARAGV